VLGELVGQIHDDCRGLGKLQIPIDQRRDAAMGVDRKVLRLLMLPLFE